VEMTPPLGPHVAETPRQPAAQFSLASASSVPRSAQHAIIVQESPLVDRRGAGGLSLLGGGRGAMSSAAGGFGDVGAGRSGFGGLGSSVVGESPYSASLSLLADATPGRAGAGGYRRGPSGDFGSPQALLGYRATGGESGSR
jgi:hypothetical protein